MPDLTKEAKKHTCKIGLFPYCTGSREGTCLCHWNKHPMGKKADDRLASIGCKNCHDIVDCRNLDPVRNGTYTNEQIELAFLRGIILTQMLWMEMDFI